MAKFLCIGVLAFGLGGCASRVPLAPPPDAPDLSQSLIPQLEMVVTRETIGQPYSKTPYALCLRMPNAPYGWVFASDGKGRDVVSVEYAALFEEAGLLVRGEPPAGFAEPHRQEKGIWYRHTPAALPYEAEEFSWDRDRLCFGRISHFVVSDLGHPEPFYKETWSRLVRYEYTVSKMPDFTQTTRFRALLKNSPINGVVRKDELFLWVPGGRWMTPFGVIRTEEIE